MRNLRRYLVTLGLALSGTGAFLAVVGALFYATLSPSDKAAVRGVLSRQAGALAVLAFLLVLALGVLVDALLRRYVTSVGRLAEEADLILTANPGRRARLEGTPELKALAAAVNRLADRHQALLEDLAARVQEAAADLEEERNRLAVLMSELTLGVVVCNAEGRILLYNTRAKHLLSEAPASPRFRGGLNRGAANPSPATAAPATPGAFVGLGRSVFGVLSRDLILHALDELHHLLQNEQTDPIAQFVTWAQTGHLVRVQMAPVLDRNRAISGYVLTLEDITHAVEFANRRDALLQNLMEGTRSSLASIRAAIESILDYPDMPPERRARLSMVIREEAVGLSRRLDEGMAEFCEHVKTQWPLEDMRGTDLLALLERRIETRLDIRATTDNADESVWLKIDSFSVIQALSYLAGRLKEEYGVREVGLRLSRGDRLAHLDMIWSGVLLPVETMRRWESDPLNVGGEAASYSLQEVAQRHGGDVWYQVDTSTHSAYFRLLLPLARPAAGRYVRVVRQSRPESRPEYYDFDLFNQPGQNPELDEAPLTDLTYTVFDTETTGLDPSGGDEIISIGAIRIVNGRLLQSEVFDQLVNPRRPVSPQSIAVTGITPDMLVDQPTIDMVLPQFHRFAEETVLVAHNAAFDMRFLQLKEQQTGVRFINPVLDTLLLSAVINPNQEVHRLEAIAERLGVNLMGRHTSLGDAIVTGEVFLKMIPLLQNKGIRTLKQAQEAARETYYARIEYSR